MDRLQHAIDSSLQKLGYKVLREHQECVIAKYIAGKDVLFCAPPDSGKSLVFEIAPLLYQHLENKQDRCTCIVVSPHSTRIKSQVQDLNKKGIKAIYLQGEEKQDVLTDIKDGKYELIFASPESLVQSARDSVCFIARTRYLKAIFVDEAQCITKSGRNKQRRSANRSFYEGLGEIRSLAGPSVPVVALASTTSEAVKAIIVKDLCLGEDTFQLNANPNNPNIKYMVFESQRRRADIAEDFDWLVDLLTRDGIQTTRMIIFFRKIEHMSDVFEHLEVSLGMHGFVNTESSTPNDCRTRLFDMYHAKTDDEVKKSIITSCLDPNGHIRVVLCSSASSVGLDVKGVSTILHYGPCNDLDDYLQESGRNMDDVCHAIIIKYKQCLSSKHVTQDMKNFINTDKCRRRILLQPFTKEDVKSETPHNCCDNCARVCSCTCSCDAPENCVCELKCSKNESYIYDRMKHFQETDFDTFGEDSEENSNEGFSTDDDFEQYRLRKPQTLGFSSDEDYITVTSLSYDH